MPHMLYVSLALISLFFNYFLDASFLRNYWTDFGGDYVFAKRVISLANGRKQKECASDLNDPDQQNEIF